MSSNSSYSCKLSDLPVGDMGLDWDVRNIRWGGMNVNYFPNIPGGFDSGPFFHGLAGNLCQSAHWGFVIRGKLLVKYPDREEIVEAGSVFYSPPGHSVKHLEDTEMIEFSPLREFESVMHVWRANVGAS